MRSMVLSFIYGFLWMLMVGVQVRMLAGDSSRPILCLWTFAMSMIWCVMVRKITIDAKIMWWYSAGTAVGVVFAVR